MKKRIRLFICLVLSGCAAVKPETDNAALLKKHPQPVMIFGIGYWKPDYMILTLTDADKAYFIITTKRNDRLKVGNRYLP